MIDPLAGYTSHLESEQLNALPAAVPETLPRPVTLTLANEVPPRGPWVTPRPSLRAKYAYASVLERRLEILQPLVSTVAQSPPQETKWKLGSSTTARATVVAPFG